MPCDRLSNLFQSHTDTLTSNNQRKGLETVFSEVIPADSTRGPRFRIEGHGERNYLRMNSNSYLGLSFQQALINAEETSVHASGTGPGAVRFISGTWSEHVALEKTIAEFHGRETAMIFSSAYATTMGVLPQLMTAKTAVFSDALNHSCIINAIALGKPGAKYVYPHLDLKTLDESLAKAAADCDRAIVVTDGIFSMRGDHAPLDEVMEITQRHDSNYKENVLLVVDDSHGVGAFGNTGRGTEEYTQSGPVDLLIGTLGKAFGVNGGYVTGSHALIDYFREVSPFYIYSNPITQGEAAAAKSAIELVDSALGLTLLEQLRQRTSQFEQGLQKLNLETIPSEHPVVPLMVRDTERTTALVSHLLENNILATGLNYPVVPKGDEEIRFQVSSDHSEEDINEVLGVLASFK